MHHLFNLKDYTIEEHIFFASGCLLWVFTYILVIRAIVKQKFVEIPVICVLANFSWEFLWSFVFKTDMGELYVWGYRIWFFLDCFIIYGLFRYGWKQWRIDYFIKYYIPLLIFGLACWFVNLYYYIDKWDLPVTHMGANSGYILNVFMSLLYPVLLLSRTNTDGFSYLSAWFKGVGTILISVFCFLKFPDQHWLLSLCVITGILDVWYIWIFTSRRKIKLT